MAGNPASTFDEVIQMRASATICGLLLLLTSRAWAGALGGATTTGWALVNGAQSFKIVYEGGARASAFVEASCRDDNSASPATECCVKRLTHQNGQTISRFEQASGCACADIDRAIFEACSAKVQPIQLDCAVHPEGDVMTDVAKDFTKKATCSLDWRQGKTEKMEVVVLGHTGPQGGGSVRVRLRTN